MRYEYGKTYMKVIDELGEYTVDTRAWPHTIMREVVRRANCYEGMMNLLQMWLDGTERGAAPPKAMLLNATRTALKNAERTEQ